MEEMGSDWISLEGKIHVASVIINRVLDSSYPNTLHGVAYQPSQFDVVTRGMIYSQEPTESVKKAVEIALKNDTTNGCLGFLVVENSNPKNVENIMKWNDVLFEKDGVSFTKPKE